ncbi:hypothetical protein C1645_822481 [Glomus cerebriforme]|uniref:Peptidase S1 domain-containing protein n=1 Tax=Glomus cerebriforme TaxID=658196 RepID=A0A397T4K3_9GLOM|nr:hypothetical protein C1645_822481 [Glomus cerebriforme]
MLRQKTASSILAYQNNAIKNDSTKGHTRIKELLFEEIRKIPGWSPDKYPGKNLSKNVYAYVKRRHKYIVNTNFLEKGEEKKAKKTIREYLYQYLETSDSDFETTTDKAEMTADELSEELGALIAIDESEVDDSILSNITKARNDPSIINSISTNLNEITENLKKIGQELSIESYMQPHITSLQRLNFILKSAAPIVGDRKVSRVRDRDILNKMVKVTLDLWKEFREKVPLSLTYPGVVDEKEYIITAVNLPKGTPVHNIPAEYNGFPLLVHYGTFKPSSNIYRQFQTLKPGISIGSAETCNACTLGALLRVKNQEDKEYILTVKHGVGNVDSSVIQPGKINSDEHHCATVKYQNLNVDDSGRLIDYAFCEVDKYGRSTISNQLCGSEVIINSFQTIMDPQYGVVDVCKVGRETGDTKGEMFPYLQSGIISELFDEDKHVNVLVVYGVDGKFGDHGDSGAPVYDQYGALWGFTRVPLKMMMKYPLSFLST